MLLSKTCAWIFYHSLKCWRHSVKCVQDSGVRPFFRTCPGLDGEGGLAPPPSVDGHDAQPVVCVGLELDRRARGAAHHGLREETPAHRLCPQDVAGCPGNLCELHGDAVAEFGVGLFDAGDIRGWWTHQSDNRITTFTTTTVLKNNLEVFLYFKTRKLPQNSNSLLLYYI